MRASDNEIYINNLLYRATIWSDYSLNLYRNAMFRYTHRWGDGVVPDLFECLENALLAASAWKLFAETLQYTVPSGATWVIHPEFESWRTENPGPEPRTTLKSHHDAVFRCVQKLFGAHQQLLTSYPQGYKETVDRDWREPYRQLIYEGNKPLALQYYLDFENFSSAIFAINDALNVLHQVMLIANPAKTATQPEHYSFKYFDPRQSNQSETYAPATIVPFLVTIPASPDPFITTSAPNYATVTMVATPLQPVTLPDEEPEPTARKREDEYTIAMRQAIDDARQGLLETRYYAMRLRRLFPWYWAWVNREPDE
jgi:hypothetical protein